MPEEQEEQEEEEGCIDQWDPTYETATTPLQGLLERLRAGIPRRVAGGVAGGDGRAGHAGQRRGAEHGAEADVGAEEKSAEQSEQSRAALPPLLRVGNGQQLAHRDHLGRGALRRAARELPA